MFRDSVVTHWLRYLLPEHEQRHVTVLQPAPRQGELASGIAHEINSPLNIIQFRVEQLRAIARQGNRDTKALSQLAESADSIEKNVARIYSIVRGLQAFARKSEQEPMESTSINELLDEALELGGNRFRFKGIDILLTRLKKDTHVQCRPVQMLQVLVNLINNAFDAIQECPERWISIEAEDVGHAVEIRVTDSGKPIPDEIARNLFQAFFTTKPAGKGTGLGLSISRAIVESHRGTLKLDRNFAHTRFLIGIPKDQSATYLKAA